MLAQKMGTVPRAPCQLPWCIDAKVGTILQAAKVQGDQADPRAPLLVECSDIFKELCGRENVLKKMRPDLVNIFTTSKQQGISFPDEWPGNPFTFHNIRNMIEYTDFPGTETFILTEKLMNKENNSGFFECRVSAPSSLESLHDTIEKKAKNLKVWNQKVDLAASYVVGSHCRKQDFEMNMLNFMRFINDSDDYFFDDFVPRLQDESHKNFRLGSFYIRELFVMINDYELCCKLHTVRMVAQFMRDFVFLVKPPADVCGLFLVGEGE